ncbi:MAG: CPBP family intramembrane glutamic endopeptidase, partial [Candidatus Syntropharchaeia archaeon]
FPAYLMLIAAAEITTIFHPVLGILFHVFILFTLLINSAYHDESVSHFFMSLSIAPLIRILSLSVPVIHFAYILWFLLISIPVFIAILVCIYLQRLSPSDVGLTLPEIRDLPLEVLGIVLAIPLGMIEYLILKPNPLGRLTPEFFILSATILIVCTGFLEEFAFRGLMQHNAYRSFGWKGIAFVTILFGILHIGNLSVPDCLLATSVGGMYAGIVKKTGSIYGVTISHGIINIILFLIAPIYFTDILRILFSWG